MQIKRNTARLVAVLMLGAVAAPIAVSATPARAEPVLACALKLANDSIKVSAEPVSLRASLSDAVGDSVSATLQQESKASVVSIGHPAPAEPNSLEITLNTSQAVPGDWSLSVKGTTGECTGKVKITAAAH